MNIPSFVNRAARLTCWAVALTCLAFLVLLIPGNLDSILGEPVVLKGGLALGGGAWPQVYAAYILVLRYVVLGLFWLAAGIVYWLGLRRPGAAPALPMLACALTLLLLPLLLNLGGTSINFARPWGDLLEKLLAVWRVGGLVSFLLFLVLFPDGRLAPGWLKASLLAGALLNCAGFLVLIFGPAIANLAFVDFLFYLVLVLLAFAGQLRRYFRRSPQEVGSVQVERRQVRGVLASIFLLVVWLCAIYFFGFSPDSPGLALLHTHLGIVIPALLPAAILRSIRRYRLWNIDRGGTLQRTSIFGIPLWGFWVMIVSLSLLGGVSLVMKANATTARVKEKLATAPAAAARPVIIDTDMAGDDALAILYLLQHPAVDIRAITVSGTGEAYCGPGVANMLSLLELVGAEELPVSCGPEKPLAGAHVFPLQWRMDVDNMFGLPLPASSRQPAGQAAPELLGDAIRNSPQKVTLLALGPLTNLALAVQADPGLADNIEMIYIMGGAVEVPGNVGPSSAIDNQVAEWNIYIDPHAANLVFRSGAPLTLVPLDATSHAPVTPAFFQRLEGRHATPAARFAYDLLSARRGVMLSGGYYFWDPLAAAILTDEDLAEYRTCALEVVESEGPYSGRTQAAPSGPAIRVAVSVDRGLFEALFLETLNLEAGR